MKIKISQRDLVETVAFGLDPKHSNDLPAIRQALNDTADVWRKDGHIVPDFSQDKLVRDVRRYMKRNF